MREELICGKQQFFLSVGFYSTANPVLWLLHYDGIATNLLSFGSLALPLLSSSALEEEGQILSVLI